MVKEKDNKKKNKNKHGFTLIELLAVIIILGVLLIIAVPAISRYIEDSRKNTYVNSVKSIVNAISNAVNDLEYPVPGKGEGIVIPFSEAELEKGVSKTKSPYAPYVEGKSYVIVTFNGQSYSYYVAVLDEAGYSIPLIESKELNTGSITTNTSTISNNVYSLEDIMKGNLLDANSFSIKYKSKVGDIIKVKIGESVYDKGDIIQLKDGTKWYSISSSNEDSKTVNLVSYNHMDTISYNYGLQSDSKTTPIIVYDLNGDVIYENADIYPTAQAIVSATQVKLVTNGLDMTGSTVDMPTVVDFCGENYDFYICSSSLSYLAGNGGFWTTESSGRYVLAVANGALSSTSTHYGSLSVDEGYGIRLVVRNLLKSNINKEATKALN